MSIEGLKRFSERNEFRAAKWRVAMREAEERRFGVIYKGEIFTSNFFNLNLYDAVLDPRIIRILHLKDFLWRNFTFLIINYIFGKDKFEKENLIIP